MGVPTSTDAAGHKAAAAAPESRLELRVYDDGRLLWQELLDAWRSSPDASLILPGRFGRDRFLLNHAAETLWGSGRVMTLVELWQEIGADVGERLELPSELLAPQIEPVLADVIDGLPALKPLSEHAGGLSSLAMHLEWIEKQADADYEPTCELERALAALREDLLEQGMVLPAALRSFLARQAKDVDLGRPLLFPPLPELTRQFGGLLKGLGRQNDVRVHLLGNEHLLPTMLALTGLGTEGRTAERFERRHGCAQLFSGREVEDGHQALPPAQWVLADDEEQAAVEIAAEWIEAGAAASSIAIVCPDSEGQAHALAEAGRSRHVPLLVRDSVETYETALGDLLARIAEADLGREREPLLIDGASAGLTDEDLDVIALARKSGRAPELRAIYELGRRLAEPRGDEPPGYEIARAQAWLEGLQTIVAAVSERRIQPWDVAALLRSNRSLRSLRGQSDGVIVVSYAELSSLEVERAILIGLNPEHYPPPQSRSPFTSPELLEQRPALASPDLRPEFVAAVAATPEAIAFVRSRSNEQGSSFWMEAQRIWGARAAEERLLHGEALSTSRLQARAHARRRAAAHAEIERALRQIRRQGLPDSLGNQPRRAYSVTELEAYLRCPYGWFVRYVLNPQLPASRQQRRGNIGHDVLAAVLEMGLAPEDRPAAVAEALLKRGQALGERERFYLQAQIERVLRNYAGVDWPFTEHLCEHSLRVDAETSEGEIITFTGRVDRIDLRPDGAGGKELLVLDYKSGRPGGETKTQLQPFLYPWMASQELEAKPLGSLYVSLRYANHLGYLDSALAGISPQGVELSYHRLATEAMGAAMRAIRGIEAGQWSTVGERCEPWCAHHLLSETGVRA